MQFSRQNTVIAVVSSFTAAVIILSSAVLFFIGCVCSLCRQSNIKQSMAGEERTGDIAVAESSPVYEDLIPQSKSNTIMQKDFELMENVAYAVSTSIVDSHRL